MTINITFCIITVEMLSESNMNKQILDQINKSIDESIKAELIGYNKPLSNTVNDVINAHRQEVFDLIDGEFSELITSDDFRSHLKAALNKKLATILVSRMGGELEKQVNQLKQNPETRAKITLAISKVIDEL